MQNIFLTLLFMVTMINPVYGDSSAIEWLQFQVPIVEQTKFIEQDKLIWDAFLSQFKAFTGKELWQSQEKPDRIITVVHWSSYDEWKSIPPDRLKTVTDRFHRALGKEYPVIESRTYRLKSRL